MKNIIITGTKGKTTLVSILDYFLRTSFGKQTILINSLGLHTNGELKRDNEYYMKKYKLSPNVTAYNELGEFQGDFDYLVGEGSYSFDSRINDTPLRNNIDIGVITNVYSDHIDGVHIQNQRDLLRAKLFVARNLREGGVLILNISNLPQNIVYETLNVDGLKEKNCIIVSTRNYEEFQGKIDYFIDDHGDIVRYGEIIGRAEEYPITFGGFHTAMNENLLTLIALCDALGFDYRLLKTIRNLNDIIPGRLNIFEGRGGMVLLDFAHEEESIKTTVNFLRKRHPGKRITGIIRLSYYRDNTYITHVSRQIAPFFDKIYIYDKAVTNTELREIYLAKLGKKLGEVGELMYETLREIHSEVYYIASEYDAIKTGIHEMAEDEILFVIGGDNLRKSAKIITDSLE